MLAPQFARKRTDVNEVSKREKQVLVRVALGKSNKEISNEIFIAPSTVKDHIDKMCKRLGAKNRTHLAVLAMARNLINKFELLRSA